MADKVEPEWRADHVRVTLFSNAVWDGRPEEFIREALGVEADTTAGRAAASELSATVAWESTNLEVRRTLNRLDVLATAPVVVEGVGPMEGAFGPSIPDARETLARLIEVVTLWCATYPRPVIRLAIGCGAYWESDSKEAAYEKLQQLLPILKIDAQRFGEMMFRVNLQKKSSSVPGIDLNRMGIWDAVFIRLASGVMGLPANISLEEKHYAHVVLDFSSAAERVDLVSASEIKNLATELYSELEGFLLRGVE